MQALPQEAWKLAESDLLNALDVSEERGLSESEVKQRQRAFGKNVLPKKRTEPLRIMLSQFASPLVLVLLAAAAISYFLEEQTSAIVILVIIVLNGILGFVQEYKSQQAAEKLGRMISYSCKVLREGVEKEIPVSELVPGDIVRMETGDRVPADIRLLSADSLMIDESVLTGESYPARKQFAPLDKASAPHDMSNIAFMGTMVNGGMGHGAVISCGTSTFFGRTASLLEESEEKSAFEKNILEFSKVLIKIIVVSLLFVFAINAFLGKGLWQSLLFSVALAVGLIPEALPIIITLALSNGSLALSKQGVIVKRLSAIEDLGNVDVLCTDKTGTLTENRMEVSEFFNAQGEQDERTIQYAAMCTSLTEHKGRLSGNPIDIAIASKLAAPKHERLQLIPFDYERRRMSAVVKLGSACIMITKGSPEAIISACSLKDRKALIDKYRELGERGYRAIAVAWKKAEPKKKYSKQDERALTFLGFITFLDPPKKTARDSLGVARKLGVQIKLITGDNSSISKNVARQTGFEFSDDQEINGERLAEIAKDGKALRECVERCVIFSRVNPIQKHLIIKTLRANGHVVAFLGDGVNDAPSLKEADVGISVNNGADVTKEAADIILMRKSINSVVQGISGGRKVFSNIMKYIVNTLAGNFGDLYTIGAASAFLKFLPLKPVQIILANFISDAPMVSISTDNVDDEELLKPKKWDVMEIAKFGALLGIVSTVLDLILIIFIINEPEPIFQTLIYIEVILSEIAVIVSLRSYRPFFRAEPPSPLLLTTIILSIVAGLALIYSPLSGLFGFAQPPVEKLALVFGIVFAYLVCTEIVKLVYIKTFRKNMEVDDKALAVLRRKIAPELH